MERNARMTEVTLGIDVGSSGVRIAARGRDGAMLAFSEAAMNLPLQSGQHLMQDPQLWWQAVKKAFEALNRDGLTIRAIAIDGTSGTILPIDGKGNPTAMASMYNDLAEPEVVARVVAAASPETAALGGSSPLARALSLAGPIIHQADWIMGQFCGRFDLTDENNALKSGYDPVARRWPDWIMRAGFNVKRFPQVLAIGTKIGSITATCAKLFNLPQDVAIVTGTTDGCAAFLASGARDTGDGVTSLGTTLTLKLLSATPIFAPQYGIYSHRLGERWLAGGASNSGGRVLAQEFKKEDLTRLTALLAPEKLTGLDYYPLPSAGERFPINDPNLAPRMTPRPADDASYFQALLEGIASIEALGYRRLAELGATPLKTMRTVGGGAANAKWTIIRLNKLQVPALKSTSEHAAMGAARLAWWGLGHAD
jgi:D-ribulokinase